MPQYVPIVTQIGTLQGRNAIYLDKVTLPEDSNTIELSGEVSCPLASKPPKARWQAYQIRFCGVLAFQMIELDTWESLQKGSWPKTSFDEVVNSPWLARMRGKASSSHRHFVFQTYDDVFEVICKTYELELKGTRD